MKKYLLLITLGFFTLTNFAQTGMPNGLDGGKYTPKSNEKKNKNKNNSSNFNNTISGSLGHLLRGAIVYSYERRIKEHLSLQGSLGISVINDQIFSIFDGVSDYNYNSNKTILNYTQRGNDFLFKANNIYGDLTLKYNTQIFESEYYFIEGYSFYAGLNFRKYRQAFSFKEDVDIHPSSVEYIPVNNTGIYFQVGEMLYKESGVTYEYYIGVGTLNRSYHTLTYQRDQTNFRDNFVYNSNASNKSKMQITLGLKYGFSF